MASTTTRVLSDAEVGRVDDCLEQLQKAQHLVDDAAQSLCGVPGFADQCGDLLALFDDIKAQWHRINSAGD